MALCLADVDRWSFGEVGSVFGVCINVADQCSTLSDTLTNLRAFSTWSGDAADAARDAVGKTRKDSDRQGRTAREVGKAARAVEEEIVAIKKRVADLRAEAEANGMQIDPRTDTVRVVDSPALQGMPEEDKLAVRREMVDLQMRLDAVLVAADAADHDLANAIKLAIGEDEEIDWVPSEKDVVLGGVAGGITAEADLVRGIWQSAMGENPKGLDARILPWLREIGETRGVKGLSKMGGVVGILTAIPSTINDVGEGDSTGKALAREGAGTAAGVAGDALAGSFLAAAEEGATAGGELGATIGSVLPGPGTAAGAVAGALVGAASAWAASKGMGWLLE